MILRNLPPLGHLLTLILASVQLTGVAFAAQPAAEVRARADSLYALGQEFYNQNEISSALEVWQESLQLFRQLKDRRQEAEVLKNLGWAYDDLGDYNRAQDCYQRSLDLGKKLNDRKLQGQVLNNLGVLQNNLSQYRQALDYLRKSLTLRREVGDLRGEASTLNNLGLTYDYLSESQEALTYYQRSLQIYTELQDSSGLSRVLGNLGIVYKNLSDYPKALDYYQQSLAIKRALGNRWGESVTLNNLGLVYDLLGEDDRALDYYQQSLTLSRELEDAKGEAETLSNLGIIYEERSDYDRALDCYERSLSLRRELGDRAGEGIALNDLGNLHFLKKDFPRALEYYQQDLDICRQLGDRRGEGHTLFNLGRLYTQKREWETALNYLQQARTIAQSYQNEAQLQLVYWALGDFYSAQGQDTTAVDYYRQVIASIENIRGQLTVEAHRSSYASEAAPIYEAVVQTLLRLNRSAEAYAYVERSRARSFLDLLASGNVKIGKSKHAEFLRREERLRQQVEAAQTQEGKIDDEQQQYALFIARKERYEPELVSLVTVSASTLPEVQSLLQTESTLLEYYVTQNEIFAWVVTPTSTHVSRISLPRDSLNLLVRGFRDALVSSGAVQQRSQRLYELLIKPLQNQLKANRLIVIPHEILHYLPFPALQDERGDYLLDHYEISVLPSASVLKYLNLKKRSKGRKLLAFGNPSTGGDETPSLPQAEQEVRAIAAQFPQAQTFTGAKATEAQFKASAPKYDLLHLACHGELNPAYPLFSSLQLAPGRGEDGSLNVYELFGLDLKADLVVLSACQTGLGRLTNGDELVGLSRAFIYAGASSVVCSLWRVADESTAFLMTQFYRYLQTYGKAEALRRAQLETRNRYSYPCSWAGFVLIGESD